MKKSLILSLALILSVSVFAFNIRTAEIGIADSSGYYNIELDPLLSAAAETDYSDLRILKTSDNEKKEVPYFVRSETPVREIRSLECYELKENIAKDSLNQIIVYNPEKENIGHFYIELQKAEVRLKMSIRGSNDMKQWYIVKQQTDISNSVNMSGNEASLIFDFPKGNYRYYEITLINNQNSPLEVFRVGKINNSYIYGQYKEIHTGGFIQKETEDNVTVISFPGLDEMFRINKIEFSVNTAQSYMRDLLICNTGNTNRVWLKISSRKNNTFLLNNFPLGGTTSVSIENNDNPPLKITSVRAYALKRYLCAYLEKGETYSIEIDNSRYSFPDYDIRHFEEEIPSNLQILYTDNIKTIRYENEITYEEDTFPWSVVLWTVIIGVGGFLIFLCVKMAGKLSRETTDNNS